MNITVDVDSLGHRGVGIARHEGKVIMVPLTAPGDRVEVRVIRTHRHYDEARMVRLLEPSPLRRDPPCPEFGRCGGCQLQHLEPTQQRALKGRLFRETLSHGALLPEALIGEILFTPEELAYRSRLEMHWACIPRARLGFKALGSLDIVPVSRCLLAMPALSPLLDAVPRALEAARVRDAVRLEMTCDAPGPGVVLTLWTVRPMPERVLEALAHEITGASGLRGMYATLGRGAAMARIWSDGDETLGARYAVAGVDTAGETALEVWPGVFSQVNPFANGLLVRTALAWLGEVPVPRVLDLYAGMGNLTFPLSRLAREVVAVEVNGRAVRNGLANGRRLGIDNVRWHEGSVETGVRRLLQRGEVFDLVVLDPPRRGAREILDGILALGPARVLYVSCDPATLTRDLRHLTEAGPYDVVRTRSLDMFPQTFHLESITLLQRGR